MNEYIPKYQTNAYIDKMFCIYCNRCATYNKNLCDRCGKKIYGGNTMNVQTSKIPPKVNYSYINALFPSKFPYIYHYGSHQGGYINL